MQQFLTLWWAPGGSGSIRRPFVGPSRIVAAVLLTFGLVACSSGGGEQVDEAAQDVGEATAGIDEANENVDELDGGDVQDALALGIGAVGITFDPDSLACSSSDDVSEGALVECDFTLNGQPVGLVAEILGVDGTKIEFDVRTEARPVPADVLAGAVATRANQQLGGTDASATCTDELAPTVGTTVTCTVTAGGDELAVEIVVDAVEGGRIDWRMQSS